MRKLIFIIIFIVTLSATTVYAANDFSDMSPSGAKLNIEHSKDDRGIKLIISDSNYGVICGKYYTQRRDDLEAMEQQVRALKNEIQPDSESELCSYDINYLTEGREYAVKELNRRIDVAIGALKYTHDTYGAESAEYFNILVQYQNVINSPEYIKILTESQSHVH